jgi:peptidoglycan-associated lipoprotein
MSRRQSASALLFLSLAAALASGCAKSPKPTLEARLGSSPTDRWGNGRGRDVAPAPGSQADLKASADDIVYFTTDSAELTPEARQTLQAQAMWLQRHADRAIVIEGHADERGTREYNIALGARRADAVRAFLAAQGVAPARMRTLSYGKERPVAVCNDISCWSQNRRAQTVLRGMPESVARY